jgi:flagellar assembly factor FliW
MDVPGDRLIHFVRPVVGFQDLDHYAVVEDEETAPVLWLQALAAPEVLLPVVDACLVTGDYGVNLADADVEALELDRADDARLLLVVTLSPDPSAITVNLRAPIVWNTRRATAMQLVLEDPKLPVSHGIGSVGGRRRSNKEVARAGPDAPQG